ncbi:MAG: hypothetical protein HN948_06725 [Clostridia bacterium]|jgi:hypothetical protein|nr:hypothetical protein [Clostridia bacterium]MBT7122687.1 hypothetical protein [Clostridia bacterium]
MGRLESNRGYLCQGVVSIFSSILENDWDGISVKYAAERDKVDIALIYSDGTLNKAVQVRSSINVFSKDDVLSWINEIMNDIDALEYNLIIIGECKKKASAFIESITKFYSLNMDNEAKRSIAGFESALSRNMIRITVLPYDADTLFREVSDSVYRFASYKDFLVDHPTLEQLSYALVSLPILFGTKGENVRKTDYENKIFRWLEHTVNNETARTDTFSDLDLLAYDGIEEEFKKSFHAYHLSDLSSFKLYKEKLLSDGKELIDKINSMKMKSFDLQIADHTDNTKSADTDKISLAKAFQFKKAELIDDEQIDYKASIKEYWGIEVKTSFFHVGNLIQENILNTRIVYEGTDVEKEKHNLINVLLFNYIFILKSIDHLSKGMQQVLFLQLTVANTANISDSNITITIPSKTNDYCLFDFDRDLSSDNKEMLDVMADIWIEKKIIGTLFGQKANSQVGTDADESVYDNPLLMPTFLGNAPKKNLEDIKKEIALYQAEESSAGFVEYDFSSIRPDESLWLEPWMMILPSTNEFEIRYSILSDALGGKKEGELVVSVE